MTHRNVLIRSYTMLGLTFCLAAAGHAYAQSGQTNTVPLDAIRGELAQLRREIADLRAGFHRDRIAGFEREREAISAELKDLQQQELQVRDQVENFERQLASTPFGNDELTQASAARDEVGGRDLGRISSRQSALAARLSACEQELRIEHRKLDETLARQQQTGEASRR